MRGLKLRTVIDRGVLAAAMIGGGLYANRVTPSLPETFAIAAGGNVRCAGHLRGLPSSERYRDIFVPVAPNEPMSDESLSDRTMPESLEN